MKLNILVLRLLSTIILLANYLNASALQVANLQTEYRINPIGIDIDNIHFSWQLLSEKRGIIQKNYRIYIHSDLSMSEIIFDSGYIEDSKSTNIVLSEFSPKPCTRYYWTVEVSNNYGETAISKSISFFETGLQDSDWSGAKWIAADINAEQSESPDEKCSPLFRKDFDLDSKIKNARLYSSALGIYTLYINGVRVGEHQEEGKIKYDELMPGWTDYRKTILYMTHDVTDLLQRGKNVLGAEVSNGWWKGRIGGGVYKSQNVAFIGKLVIELENGSIVSIVTDSDWKFSKDGPIISSDLYDGEIYDARREQNWTDPEYDASSWDQCNEDTQPKGKLTAHIGPTVRIRPELERYPKELTIYEGIKDNGTSYGEINVVNTLSECSPIRLKKGQTMLVDFGQNASGFVKIKVQGERGTTIDIRYAEMINDSGDPERGNDGPKGSLYTLALRSAKACTQYIMNGDIKGEIYIPTSTFFGFRYCDIKASENIYIESITAETISSLDKKSSYFTSNNSDVNQLYSNILWGQRSNFISVPTDCPQRDERWGWTADTQVFSMTACYNSDVQGFYHKWMQDLRDGQQPDGQYPNAVPLVNGANHYGASAWADAGVILPWNVYIMYGDKAIIEENYDSMKKYLDWIFERKDEEYNYSGAIPTFGDWLAFENTDKRFVSVAYYAYIVNLMAKMSTVLSNEPNDYYDEQALYYKNLFSAIKDEFILRYWDNEQMCLTQSSQCALLMALRFNLLPNEEAVETTKQQLRESIIRNGIRLSTGFLGTSIINQTLSENGMDDLAYDLLLQHECPSWLYCVDQGATTIWERWNSYTLEDGFSKNIGMNSFNHYAYGALGEWMYRHMAGIIPDIDNPGFKHVILKPSFDSSLRISNVESNFASIYGDIKVKWSYRPDHSYDYYVSIPTNTTATLTLPTENFDKILLEDGENISESIREYMITDNGLSVKMELGSGEYSFKYDIPNTSGMQMISGRDLKITPNPSSDIVKVTIQKEIRNIEVISISGTIIASSQGSEFVNISNAIPGLYIISVCDHEGKKYTGKLIKR